MKEYEHAYYLENVIRPRNLRTTIELVKRALTGHQFDTIAFRGMSGALIAPALALDLGKELIMVRKETEFKGEDATHSSHPVEGYMACKRYVIIDDLISSGRTVCAVYRAIKEFTPEAECIGMLGYMVLSDEVISRELEHRHGMDDPNFQLQKPTNPKRIMTGGTCCWDKDYPPYKVPEKVIEDKNKAWAPEPEVQWIKFVPSGYDPQSAWKNAEDKRFEFLDEYNKACNIEAAEIRAYELIKGE